MNHRALARFAVCLALAAAAAGCGNPTADKPAAQVSEPVDLQAQAAGSDGGEGGAAASPEDAAVVFTFTDNSSIDFEGYKVTGPHIGGFGQVEGAVTVPGDDLEQAQITVTIDMTSVYSDNPDLTNKLKGEDFFEVETYPKASFVSTGIELYPDGTFAVTGNLELHGITKGVTFPATIERAGDTLTTEAEFTINRFDWDIVYQGMADDLIRKDVLIYFEIEAAASETP